MICDVVLLVCVIKLTPFTDANGHEGWSIGDKGQVVSQLAMLVEFAIMGTLVFFTDDPEELPVIVEAIVTALILFCIVFPIIYMLRLDKGHDMLPFLWRCGSNPQRSVSDQVNARDDVCINPVGDDGDDSDDNDNE